MDMLDIPLRLRQQLHSNYKIGSLEVEKELISFDGTVKRAYELGDKQYIESVLMQYHDGRKTACISSQAGCAMKCSFCATGQMGFRRQLYQFEIFEQVLRFDTYLKARDKTKTGLTNVVFMGTILFRVG